MSDPHTLTELLSRRAARQAERRAYAFLPEGESDEVSVSYGELDARARAVGSALARAGAAGERVMLLYPPGLDYAAAFFGCLYAGAVAVPAYPPRPNRTLERVEAMAADSQAAFALTTAKLLPKVKTYVAHSPALGGLRWLSTEEAEAEGAGAGGLGPARAEPGSLAYLQYTSGSTALPKGVMISHANVLHNAAYIHEGFGHTPDSVSLSWLPHFHDMGLVDGVVVPLYGGFRAYLMPPAAFLQKPLRWLEAVTRLGVTHTGGPNFAYELCLRRIPPDARAALDLSGWAVAYNGAEPVRWETLERFAAAFAPCGFRPEAFYPAYGLAEATLKVTGGSRAAAPVRRAVQAEALKLNRVVEAAADDAGAQVLVGSGRAGAGTRVEIVDPETHTACAESAVGEVWVSSASVAGGYWRRPEETEQTFHARLAGTDEGPFLRTGDLGFVRDGELFVTGRLKDVIIIRGLNHYPQDIERTAEESHAALRPGCGAAFPVEAGGAERLVLVLEVERAPQSPPEEVIAAVRRAVGEDHAVQAHAVVLVKAHSIPKTSSGKIQRRACRAMYLGGSLEVVAAWREAAPPADATADTYAPREAAEVEDLLAARIAEKLGVPRADVDVDTPIARFGLDSLAAIELTHELETGLGVRLPMASLLQDFSVAQLAARLASDPEDGADDAPACAAAEGADEHPLSYGQRAMWFLYRLAPESPAYNIPVAVRIPGELDASALRRAFGSLVERHASLRATFHESADGGEPVQRIHEGAVFDFVEVDAAPWSERLLQGSLVAEAHRPFDLGAGPVLRVTLYRRSAREHVLLLIVHHIAADFWSLATLMRELGTFYEAETSGQPASLAPPALRYTDYARWQIAALAGRRGERLGDFWERQLAGEPPRLDLPTDRPRPPVQTFNGASHTVRLGADLTRDLKEFGRARGATLYMTLLAAFQVLLHRYTGQEDFAVGSPTSGRDHSGLADVVGYFVNPLALRAELAGDPTFEELLGRVRRHVVAAFEHQDYPFPLLVERLQPARDPSHSPLFQVLFILQKAHSRNAAGIASLALGEAGARVELGGLVLESLSLEQRVAQFDLTLMMVEEGGGLAASLQYNTDLFDAPTVERMASHFRHLLEGALADPTRRVGGLPLLGEAERRLILDDFNETAADYERGLCLHQLFARQAARTPEAEAVVCGDTALTYRELDGRANRLARHLRSLGVGRESLVGVLLERTEQMVVSVLAVLKAGGAYVPLDPVYPPERLRFTLEDSRAGVLITQQSLLARDSLSGLLEGVRAEVVCVDADSPLISAHEASAPPCAATADNLAYVIYTSGSTGRPKGVAIAHQSAAALVAWALSVYDAGQLRGVLASTSLCFDLSVFELFAPLSCGGCVLVADRALSLAAVAARREVTLVNTVPSAMAELLRAGDVPRGLGAVNLAGEPLTRALAEGTYAAGAARVYNLYGPTEDTTYSTWELVGRGGEPTIGRPVSNTRAYVLDRGMSPAPLGVAGELYLGGEGLARGYLNRPSLTAERFVPDPFSAEGGGRLYRTGDVVRRLPDGRLEFMGRADHQVKVRGFRIELGEVEAALGECAGVRECVVVAREFEGGDKRLVAYVVAEAGAGGLSTAELRAHLKRRLPDYMAPAAFVKLEAMPLTPNGKVDRKALPEPGRAESGVEYLGARSPVEDVIAGIYGQALGLRDVGVHDNFFELGGHSLLAMQVVSRLNDAFDLEVPLHALFESPTVAALAEHVEASIAGGQVSTTTPVVPAPRGDAPPLSYQQRRLWFLNQLEPDDPSYNMAGALRLKGRLDAEALERSFNQVVARHEVLRTAFVEVDGEPVQVVEPALRLTLPALDLSALPEGPKRERLEALLREEAERPFDLMRCPLLRLRLLRLDEDEHVLQLTMHHIISDGWSLGVLVREVGLLYDAYSRGVAAALPALPVQYADYALWQRERLEGGELERQLAYWEGRLAGVPEALALPLDRPRRAGGGRRGGAVAFALPAALTSALKAAARGEGATLFMALLAGFEALLYRHSGQESFAVGTPVAGRGREELKGLVGFFVNTLALPADVSGDPTYAGLLGRVRAEALGGYAHAGAPFEGVVERLRPSRALDRPPIFQVMLALDNTPQEELKLGDLVAERVELRDASVKYDLSLSLREEGGGLSATLGYDAGLFDEATARRLAERYVRLLADAAADPSRRVSELPLLTGQERRQLAEWNETRREYPAGETVHGLFERQARLTPDAVALVFEGESLTYAGLDARAGRLASRLRALGVGPESRVGVLLGRSTGLVVALLGVLKAGGAYVPLDPEYPERRLRFMAEDAGLSLVLTQERLAGAAESWDVGVKVLSLDGGWEKFEQEAGGRVAPGASPENLAYVIYTSGSTGRPKGVCVSHRAICNHLLWRQEAYPLSPADRFLHKASVSFDIGTWEIFAPLVAGARSVIARPGGQQDGAYLARLMASERVTVAHFGPAMLRAMLDEPELKDCANLRQVFCGGEPLTPELQARFFERLGAASLHQQYGPTETTVDVTVWDCRQDGPQHRIPIGRPIANTRLYVLDRWMRPVPAGVGGELYVGGAPLARGYHGRPALTAERFVPDPLSGEAGGRLYRTGDLGRHLPDGSVEFLGRADNQVKVRGFRVEPGEVEAALGRQAGVRECVVVASEDESGDKRLVAYLICEEGKTLVIADVRRGLKALLPDYMVPSSLVLLEEWPLTPSGKVDRQRLPAAGDAARATAGEVEPPRTPTEELLAGMWEELLGVGRVGAEDDFFELGGHSLLAARLAARVREGFGVELALRKVFEAPTVRGLAAEVEAALGGGRRAEAPVGRRGGEGPAPLSYAQQRLWFLDQLEPCNAAYNMSAAVRMAGPLDVGALEGALGEVVRRHEVLRTTFRLEGDAPVQVIGPPLPFDVPVYDLAALTDEEREAEVARRTREEAGLPFDLARGPLLRASLLRLGAEEHVLLFTMHHIVADAWSVDVLVRELTGLYEGGVTGQPAALPALPVQYADYAVWQRAWLTGEVLGRQLDYWRGRLGGAPAALALPTDKPRPAVQSYRGASESFRLSARTLYELKRVSRQHGVTLFMTLLAGLKTLLGRYTHQSDLVVGTPVAGRGRAEVEPLVGFFANTLALRTDLSGDPTFAELLARVRETALGAYAHQDVPFEMLVEELRPERDLSRQPLFQVMLVLQYARDAALRLHSLESELTRTASETSKFDLLMSLEESEQGLAGVLEYSTDLFEAETVRRMTGHFEVLLEAAAQSPGLRVSELPLLGEEEREALLARSRGGVRTDAPVECLHRVFAARAAATPDAPAVVHGDERVSYGELNRRANRLAHSLRRRGVGPESRVGLCAERSVEMVVGLLGILKAGAAYVPLDPEYPRARLALMLEDARVSVVLTQRRIEERLPPRAWDVLHLDGVEPEGAREESEPESGVTPDNIAYVLYTSGSTGVPKGVALGHGALANLIAWQRGEAPLPEGARTLQFTSLNFDVSFQEIFSTLCEGGALVLVSEDERRDPVRLLRLVERERVGRLYLPFVALRELAEAAEGLHAAPPDLRQVITAGEQLQVTPAVARFFGRLEGCTLYNHYGPSETHVVTAYELRGEPSAWPQLPPIGRPIANTRLYVLDRWMRPVPAGVGGELYVGGAPLARGYHGRPALTAERFVPDPLSGEAGARLYRTGDLGRHLPDGSVEFLGRADNQVKVRGFRVEPGEVEAALGECAGVRQAVVLAQEWGGGGRRLAAYVMPVDGRAALTAGELRGELRRRLPDYMVPSAFVFVDEWPLTPSGKVDRRRLPAPGPESADTETSEPPRTPTEELLAGMWEELLGVGRVGAEDDFFELGGHSLLAARLAARVREGFGVELALRKVFEAPTVRGLAAEVEAALGGGGGAAGARGGRRGGEGPAPLSYAQQRLWFLDQLEPHQSAYNLTSATRILGALNVAALEQSFNEVARRHEVMRTTFPAVEGKPVAVSHPHRFAPLEVLNLAALNEEARAAELKRLSEDEAQKPFDLARGPLWRASVVRLGGEEHVLLFTMHHIISDGWSLGVLVREVAACYEAFGNGSAPALPALPVQYADYALWQRRRADEYEEQLAYWEGRLAGVPEALELPTDRPRRPGSERRGGAVAFALPAALTSALKAVARGEGATLFMALLAGFEALLYRHSGQEAFAVGTPVAGRGREELKGLIGFFVNTLALPADVSGDPTYAGLLGRVRAEALGGYAHAGAPFEGVVERLRPSRALDRPPIFQAMLALDNTPQEELRLGALRVERLPADGGAAKYDLSLSLREEGGGLSATLSYDAGLFDEASVRALAERYEVLLKGAAADPSRRVSELPLLTEWERQQLAEWNETRREYPVGETVHGLFERQARLTPEAVAVAGGDGQLTYAGLDARAGRLASRLRALGVGPESRVGVLLGRSTGLVVALLGVLKAGGAYVPLDPEYPEQRLRFMAEDAGLSVLLTRSGLRAALKGCAAPVVCLDELGDEDAGAEGAPAGGGAASPENLAYVIYTSGSTGRPKGVCVSHRSLLNLVAWHREAFAVTARDRATQLAGVSFDASVWEIWPYLASGASLRLPDEETRLTPERLRDWLLSGEITITYLPTPLAEQVLTLRWPREAALRILLTGGDRLQKHPPQGLPFEVVNNYGPTECTVVATSGPVRPADESGTAPSIGRPLANARVYVLDKFFNPVPVGAPGELYVGGEGVARGYLNRPALTAERFVPDPFSTKAGERLYRTGDLVRYLADGNVEFLGRADHQVKVRGFRVELGEIETVLSGHAGVAGCAVVAREDAQGRRALVAYLVGRAGASPSKEELRAHLKARVPEYMIPSAFVPLEALPLTRNGKVDRRALAALAPGAEASEVYVAPRGATEEALAKIWSEVLGVERVGATDDFFELGGHSLLATQVTWKVREAFGVELPLRALFEHPTVAALSTLVEGERARGKGSNAPAAIAPFARERFRATLSTEQSAEQSEVLGKN
jgi:amino acid adenylation domain-containing protein